MIAKLKALTIILIGCGLCFGQEQQISASIPIFATKVVKGMPFSAKVITDSNQLLADGNRISRTSVASIVRDSEGRTRREQVLPRAGTGSTTSSSVFIQDPVSGSAYVFDPQSRLARKWSVSSVDSARQPAEIHGSMGKNESSNIKTESLGTQVLEGILTEGTRITRTLSAGEAGNERPLDIVSETWYSSELQTIVLSKTRDPRLGDAIYRLTEIQRSEPFHSLFEIPADYIIREESAPPTTDKVRIK